MLAHATTPGSDVIARNAIHSASFENVTIARFLFLRALPCCSSFSYSAKEYSSIPPFLARRLTARSADSPNYPIKRAKVWRYRQIIRRRTVWERALRNSRRRFRSSERSLLISRGSPGSTAVHRAVRAPVDHRANKSRSLAPT